MRPVGWIHKELTLKIRLVLDRSWFRKQIKNAMQYPLTLQSVIIHLNIWCPRGSGKSLSNLWKCSLVDVIVSNFQIIIQFHQVITSCDFLLHEIISTERCLMSSPYPSHPIRLRQHFSYLIVVAGKMLENKPHHMSEGTRLTPKPNQSYIHGRRRENRSLNLTNIPRDL